MSRVVVIAGGSAGIGLAAAEIFARRGWNIGLIAREAERLEQAEARLREIGAGRVAVVPADVADVDAVEQAADLFEEELGPIGVWVNNAMVTAYGPFDKIKPDAFRRITEVVYLGQVNGVRAALRVMRPRNRGTIVCVGSALAYRAIPMQSAYCGAKYALRGFLDAMHAELIHQGSSVRLSLVNLPGVNTPQFDMGRNRMNKLPRPAAPVFQPEVAARAIVRAADEGERELFVGLPSVGLTMGNMVAPHLLDRVLAKQGPSGQQREDDEPGGREDYVYDPVEGAAETHGSFDDEAKSRAVVVNGWMLRGLLFGGIGLGGLALGLLLGGGRR